MTTPQQQIIDKCKAVFTKVKELYGLDMSHVGIRFDLKGRAAGYAHRNGDRFYMRFNNDMLTREAFEHVINDTVPHEIAHIVCFTNRTLGSKHDAGWARVCRALGGSGARCHDEEVVFGKGTTYEYTTDRGNKVRVSDKHHNVIQGGRPVTWTKGLGKVVAHSAYSIVGVQGRTLATPVVKVPVVPVAAVKPFVPTQPAPGAWYPGAVNRAVTVPTVAPVQQPVVRTPAVTFAAGASKASISRSIMLAGHTRGLPYEQIIAAMQAACGYDRQLARATFKANCVKVGIPVQ